MSIVHLRPPKLISRDWIQRHIEWLWGFRLDEWQLDDLTKLLNGGIYSVMYPTDFGKSMLIEMYVVLSLMRDPQRRKIVVKINDSAATECAAEIARKCETAATHECPVCNRDHTELRPKVQWRGGEPYGISDGFWIAGCDRDVGRNINRSVRCYGVGTRDLQGKRGDTLVDDLERREEATSIAERARLVSRVGAVMRTLEDPGDDPHMLWALFGTPQHEESIMFELTARLEGIGVQYEQIHRPLAELLTTPMGHRRRQKMEVHRRTMPRSEFAAAYELRPRQGRLTLADLDQLVKAKEVPKALNERQFYDWLHHKILREQPQHRDSRTWQKETLAKLAGLEFYIGWDPATTGDWAVAVTAIYGSQLFCLRAHLGMGDAWEQAIRVRDYFLAYPSATIVVEKNAQQKAFRDILEVACPEASIYGHGTFSNKNSEQIGIPALIKELWEGNFHLPWADEEWAEDEFQDLLLELQRWGPTAHPHLIPAIWFTWYFSRRSDVQDRAERRLKHQQFEEATQDVRIVQSHPAALKMPANVNAHLRRQSKAAWGRHYKRG